MKSPWTRIWARSHLSPSKSLILLLWYQQTASWLPVPPFQETKYSDPNTKGPMFWWSKVSPWDRPSHGSLGKHSTNKILQDLCTGELIHFEFPIFCQHRIAQDGDKSEQTKGLKILKFLQCFTSVGDLVFDDPTSLPSYFFNGFYLNRWNMYFQKRLVLVLCESKLLNVTYYSLH